MSAHVVVAPYTSGWLSHEWDGVNSVKQSTHVFETLLQKYKINFYMFIFHTSEKKCHRNLIGRLRKSDISYKKSDMMIFCYFATETTQWSTCVIYQSDLPEWSTWGIYLCDLPEGSTCVIYLCDLPEGSTWGIYLSDLPEWSTWGICLRDLPVWSTWVIYLCDLPVWSTWGIYLRDLPVWSTWGIYLRDLPACRREQQTNCIEPPETVSSSWISCWRGGNISTPRSNTNRNMGHL